MRNYITSYSLAFSRIPPITRITRLAGFYQPRIKQIRLYAIRVTISFSEVTFGEYCGNRIKTLIVSGTKPFAEYHVAGEGGLLYGAGWRAGRGAEW